MTVIDADQWDRQRRVRGWRQEAVENARCLVVGAGALGNEVVKNLLQLGVRRITLVDFDTVEVANLNRCVFFTAADAEKRTPKAVALSKAAVGINPSAEVTYVLSRVENLREGFFTKFDYAFSCLDNLGARLHLNAHCYGVAPLIDGGTTGFSGKVQAVKAPSPCLECSLSKPDYALLWRKYSCVGDALDFIDPKMPALPTTTSIIAAIQANEFVKLAHLKHAGALPDSAGLIHTRASRSGGKDGKFAFPEAGLVGKYLFYNGLTNETRIFEVPKRKSCPVHYSRRQDNGL